MQNSLQHFVSDLITLFVVIHPIGILPVFLSVTHDMEAPMQRRVASRATLIAYGVLLFFIVAGQFLLNVIGIRLYSFQLAGSLVLLLFALTMIFGIGANFSIDLTKVPDAERAVFPLAIPAIAGPGTMLAVVMLTDDDRFTFAEQMQTAATLGLVLLLTWAIMWLAKPILNLIHRTGASIVERVMGLLLASFAVDGLVQAITAIVRQPG